MNGNPQKKKFERILSNTDKHDAYALVMLGNIHHRSVKFEQAKPQIEQCYKRALEHYHKALSLDPHNMYAANGIGMILAEKGHFQQAKDVFLKVREAVAGNVSSISNSNSNQSFANQNNSIYFPDSWINLAHIYSELGQHMNAIKLYESCLKKFYENKDVPLLIYIARAYFAIGKEEKDSEMIVKSRKCLEKALLIRPWDHSIRFNIAYTQQECAVITLKKSIHSRTIKQVKQAYDQIHSASEIFKYLSETTPYPKNSYEPRMAGERGKFCENSLKPAAQKHLDQQIKEDKGKEEKILTLEAQRLKNEEESRIQQEEERKRKEQEQDELERKREEFATKAVQAISSAIVEDDSKGKRKKADSDNDSDQSDDENKKEKSKKRERKRKEKDDDGESKKSKKRRRKEKEKDKEKGKGKRKNGDGDDDEENEGNSKNTSAEDSEPEEMKRKKGLAALKQKRARKSESSPKKRGKMDDFIEDSDDNEDENNHNRDDDDDQKSDDDKDEKSEDENNHKSDDDNDQKSDDDKDDKDDKQENQTNQNKQSDSD